MNLRDISFWAVFGDQVSKYLVTRFCHFGEPVTVFKNILSITYILNPGAAFGFMANTQPLIRIPFFILITLTAGLAVYAYQRFLPAERKWQRLALGLIWGGAMGNFLDRIIHSQVVDFIDVERISLGPLHWGTHVLGPYHFPYIFNLADSCITVGLSLLLISYLLDKPHPTGVSV